MLTKVIKGYNATPGAPANWTPEKHGQCGVLPIRVTRDPETGQPVFCESAWELTPKEIAALVMGGQIVLRVYGWQCPVAMYVEAAGSD